MKQKIYEAFCNAVGEKQVLREEPMKYHTTFRTGGPAEYFIKPKSGEEIRQLIAICKENNIPYYVVGNGSNLLVSDEGFKGAVIRIGKEMSDIHFEGNQVTAAAGVSLAFLAMEVGKRGFAGFEFATGIPGALGGAVAMNAGAYGGEMAQIIKSALVLDGDGNIHNLSLEELALGYRTSVIQKDGLIVLEVKMEFQPGNQDEINGRQAEFKKAREEKQPLEYASAGSTFKRPEGHFAGKLIMDAGLRGCSVGDAQISEKHCGFLINRGEASARDIIELMKQVREKVYNQYGVMLEPEVRLLGFEENPFA